MRLIDADALIEDLKYDLDLDLRALDDFSCVGLTRTLTEQAVEFKRDIIKQLKDIKPVKGEWLRGDAYPHHIYIVQDALKRTYPTMSGTCGNLMTIFRCREISARTAEQI